MIEVYLLGGPLDGKFVELDCGDEAFMFCSLGYEKDGAQLVAQYKRYSPPGQGGRVVAIYVTLDSVLFEEHLEPVHKPATLDFDELADRGDEAKTYGLVELMEIFRSEE